MQARSIRCRSFCYMLACSAFVALSPLFVLFSFHLFLILKKKIICIIKLMRHLNIYKISFLFSTTKHNNHNLCLGDKENLLHKQTCNNLSCSFFILPKTLSFSLQKHLFAWYIKLNKTSHYPNICKITWNLFSSFLQKMCYEWTYISWIL